MMKLRMTGLAILLVALATVTRVALLADGEADLAQTLSRGMMHRESLVGPLTGSLTLVKIETQYEREVLAEELARLGAPEMELPEGEPGVVAVAFREADDLRWELQAQALTRGYNDWVSSPLEAEKTHVSDLYSVTVCDGTNVY